MPRLPRAVPGRERGWNQERVGPLSRYAGAMPWTFAHPAAILPLRQCGRLPLSALVIGSLSPDFCYYLGLISWAGFTHSWSGVLGFSLPVGGLLWLLWIALRKNIIDLLPVVHRVVAENRHELGIKSGWSAPLIGVLLALIIGASTHIVWDAFTHGSGWVVQQLPLLQLPLLQIAGRTLHVFNLLQHGSTVVGLSALAWVFGAGCQRHGSAGCGPTRAMAGAGRCGVGSWCWPAWLRRSWWLTAVGC